jgi:hypothetical protein
MKCENCFSTEHHSFLTEEEWLKFDLALTKKLGAGKIIELEFIRDSKRDKDDGEYIYSCNVCPQKWRLKVPDQAFRGYFILMK